MSIGILSLSLLLVWLTYKCFVIGKREANLPPGPPTLPLLGNIHLIPRVFMHYLYVPSLGLILILNVVPTDLRIGPRNMEKYTLWNWLIRRWSCLIALKQSDILWISAEQLRAIALRCIWRILLEKDSTLRLWVPVSHLELVEIRSSSDLSFRLGSLEGSAESFKDIPNAWISGQ